MNVYRCTPDLTKYTGQDNYGHDKQEYVAKLQAMELPALEKETESKIWLSAYAANNPRSDYHWHVDACWDVLMLRTGTDEAYAACYKRVWDSQFR